MIAARSVVLLDHAALDLGVLLHESNVLDLRVVLVVTISEVRFLAFASLTFLSIRRILVVIIIFVIFLD